MAREVTVKILNEVYMMVVGLHGTDTEYFYDKYGVFAPNYFHSPKFKLGRWDGKIRYFQKTGKTYLFLIEEILPQLKNFGYKINIEDKRTMNVVYPEPIDENLFADILHPDTGEPIILRDYQVDAVNTVLEHGFGLIIAGTGAGKTLSCAALLKAYDPYGIKTITIVPDQNLIRQTKKDYINCGLDTGEYSGTHKTLDHQHVVSTWQALKNTPAIMSTFGLIIVDECHGLKGPVLQSLIADYAANIPYRFGFTGTLPKEKADRQAVHNTVGPVRYEIPAHELIERKVLATLQIDIMQLDEDLTKQYNQYCDELVLENPKPYKDFKDEYFADFSAEKSYIQRKEARLNWIADYIETKRNDKKGNVLCLVSSVPLARTLAKRIPGAICVNGQDVKDPVKREQIYDLFKTQDDLVVIATVHIAGTGLSINRIFNLIGVDLGKSFIRVIQSIGRGLRKSKDKDHVTFSDICSDLKYGKLHLAERIKYYSEAKYPYTKKVIQYDKKTLDI